MYLDHQTGSANGVIGVLHLFLSSTINQSIDLELVWTLTLLIRNKIPRCFKYSWTVPESETESINFFFILIAFKFVEDTKLCLNPK